VAIGITGLKMETTQNLVVSFRAPEKFRRSYYKRFKFQKSKRRQMQMGYV
jgi:hypothetical protein